MIYIFAAMYCEANIIIEQYGLKKSSNQFFDVYESEDMILTITGVGKLRAATAVSHIISSYGYNNCHILNIGCACGNDVGSIYVASTVTDDASHRDYYPDLVIDFNLNETKVITVDNPVSENSNNVYDMEASGIVQASSCYLGPDRITVLKLISDNGSSITSVDISSLFENSKNIIYRVIDTIHQFYQGRNDSYGFELDKLANDLKCSEYMRGTLKQLLIYAHCRDIDIEQIITDYLPVADRRRGKEILDELRQRLTS